MSDPNELFAIVPCSHGHVPEDAIVTGNLSQITEYIPQSVARDEREAQLADAERDAEETERFHDEVRQRAAHILADGITRLNERLDAFEAKRQAQADQLQREKEEAEAARIAAELAALPDPDNYTMGDDGDFQAVHDPVDTEKHDPEHRNEAATGLMPKELDIGAPPQPGNYVPTTPPSSPYRDPTAIGGF
jgi:hypothetical protein